MGCIYLLDEFKYFMEVECIVIPIYNKTNYLHVVYRFVRY